MADLPDEPSPDQPQHSVSDSPADAPAATPIAAGAECPSCGYSIGGLPIPKCPECGRGIRAIEVRLGDARKMFLELTNVRVFALPAVLILFAWWLQAGVVLPVLGLLCMALGAVFGEWIARTTSGLEQRLIRRLWWLALPFAQGTWLAAAIVPSVYYTFFAREYSYYYSRWARIWGDISDTESTVVFVIAVAAGLLGWLVWRWRWNKMCILLGVPETVRTGPAFQRAMRYTHLVPLAIVSVLLAIWVTSKLLNLILDSFPRIYS